MLTTGFLCDIYIQISEMKEDLKGKVLKDMLWNAATATIVQYFDFHMGEIQKVDKQAFEWLVRKQPSTWTRSHFSAYPKCGMLLINFM